MSTAINASREAHRAGADPLANHTNGLTSPVRFNGSVFVPDQPGSIAAPRRPADNFTAVGTYGGPLNTTTQIGPAGGVAPFELANTSHGPPTVSYGIDETLREFSHGSPPRQVLQSIHPMAWGHHNGDTDLLAAAWRDMPQLPPEVLPSSYEEDFDGSTALSRNRNSSQEPSGFDESGDPG